ncbi:MAG: RDD family protein [Dokdonella sp.]
MEQRPPPLPTMNPYAAPSARVSDVSHEGEQELADRGTRLGAAILDGLVVGGPVALIAIAAAIAIPSYKQAGGGQPNPFLFGLLGFAIFAVMIGIAVVNMVLLHRHGQTLAKRWLNIKIVRTDGSPCSLLRIIFARFLPVALLGAIPLIGYFISLVDSLLIFRQDYRCLHDHFADTIVVKA